MRKLRVVIGTGTPADLCRRAAPGPARTLGPDGLWAGRTPDGTPFGDPHQARDSSRTGGPADDTVFVPGAVAQGVGRTGRGKLVVKTARLTLIADEVVIVNGVGPQRRPGTPRGMPAATGFPQVMAGTDYLDARPPYGRDVLVCGGGATAAWVAATAAGRCRRLLWVAGSDPHGPFRPDGNSHPLLGAARKQRLDDTEVLDLEYLPALRLGGRVARRPLVKVTLKPRTGPLKICLVDQFVHAAGGDPDAPGALGRILSRPLLAQLQPLHDRGRVVRAGAGTLAWTTPRRDLFVVGPATPAVCTDRFQAEAGPLLPLARAARVPDRVPLVTASTPAVSRPAPVAPGRPANPCDPTLSAGDRNQLAAYLAACYDLGPHVATEIASQVIRRSEHGPGLEVGLSEDVFETTLSPYLRS